MIDLCTNCALCGGKMYITLPADMPRTMAFKLTDDELEDYYTCTCESRSGKGSCGRCRNCRIAEIGCACDGAFDAGCFNCTPDEFDRPPCPLENFVKEAS